MKGLLNFGKDFSKNVVIFGVDISSSSNVDNNKTNVLVLGAGSIYDNNGRFDAADKMLSINFNIEKKNILQYWQ